MAQREPGDSRRRRLEGVIPELLKRAVELGVEKASEAPDSFKHFMHDLKLPKEIVGHILAQVDETKNGLFRVVAKEIRHFLEHTHFARELQKVLTTVQFEVNTTIRFTPNEAKSKDSKKTGDDDSANRPVPKPEITTDLYIKREDRPRDRRRPRD